MSVSRAARQVVLPSLLCLFFAGCDVVHTLTQWPWPSQRAIAAFDTHPVEAKRATWIAEALYFDWGMFQVCGDFPLPPGVHFEPGEDRQLEDEIGTASRSELLAEIERLHPGAHDNSDISDGIWWGMMLREAKRGEEAAKARGCEAMRRTDAQAIRALRSWRPAGQSGPPPSAAATP